MPPRRCFGRAWALGAPAHFPILRIMAEGELSPHLQRLEDESLFILREVAAEFRRPVMLYSVGKDSSVMLHLARKAFFPAPPPFPFLHIASGWDFAALLAHRDRMAAAYGLELLVHSNEE